MWECGLKHYVDGVIYKAAKSLLMWECGLKLCLRCMLPLGLVTPYVGVWIETLPDEDYTDAMAGHSLCGSVD